MFLYSQPENIEKVPRGDDAENAFPPRLERRTAFPPASSIHPARKEIAMTVLWVVGCAVAVSLVIELFLGRTWLLRQRREHNETIFQSRQYGSQDSRGREEKV
jgi:hypothetical protein